MKKLIIIFLTFSIIQCEKSFEPIGISTTREFTALEKQVASSADRFGLKLMKSVNSTQQDSNVFLSPLSVSMALGMTLNGANNETYDAMQSTLELNGLTQQQINETYKSLIELLTQIDPKVVFNIANSIWYRQGWIFEQQFIDVNKKYFNALVKDLDFNDPAAPTIINDWVYNNTNGKIDKIIDRIDPTIVMYLINAIYFKGTWKYEFDKNETVDDLFYTANGSQILCKIMVQTNDFSYFQNSDFQAIDLPYGDGHFSMTVLLPVPEKNVDSIITNFSEESWDLTLNSFSTQEGTLFLPRFELEYKITLNDVLISLGMGNAFTPGLADFTKMYTGPFELFIDEVKHKTFVKVDEEGTEAAAVTSVSIGFTSTGGSGFTMRVDRPFVFIIREKNSGSILFIGKILEPIFEE
jgi:serine protease inhibitor